MLYTLRAEEEWLAWCISRWDVTSPVEATSTSPPSRPSLARYMVVLRPVPPACCPISPGDALEELPCNPPGQGTSISSDEHGAQHGARTGRRSDTVFGITCLNTCLSTCLCLDTSLVQTGFAVLVCAVPGQASRAFRTSWILPEHIEKLIEISSAQSSVGAQTCQAMRRNSRSYRRYLSVFRFRDKQLTDRSPPRRACVSNRYRYCKLGSCHQHCHRFVVTGSRRQPHLGFR